VATNYASRDELMAFCEWLLVGGHLHNGNTCEELVDEYRASHGVPDVVGPEDDTQPVDVK
jgi:hypothetical protein